jgi:hypothetical protein
MRSHDCHPFIRRLIVKGWLCVDGASRPASFLRGRVTLARRFSLVTYLMQMAAMEQQLRANAELVLRELREIAGADFGYTEESVKWLEGYIERLRESAEFEGPETKTRLISVFGSFLGECVIRCYGGTWKLHDEIGAWCVALKEGGFAFPFAKVAKQFDYGLEDGIVSFFNVVPIIFKDPPSTTTSISKKPWWKFW